ncbi:MAG: SDR family oxidoreductase [Sphingomonadales bacterium]|nr:SDR family oxidoreductase [Sphingomonadales bacterium]MBU3993956.1 SDR family oxidoreductase [Alphaproteobacteria bacterium]
MANKRALVTGASRGIGKAIALALAENGYDVAVSGRTVNPGEKHDNGPGLASTVAMPGSLAETVAEIEQRGARGLAVAMDLTDRGAVGAAGQMLLDAWGGLDLLVNNGRHIGPGLSESFLDVPTPAYDNFWEAHTIAPIILTRLFLPGMLERGEGQLITVTSSAGFTVPPGPPGVAGWGLGYAVGKASGHMLAGAIHAEFSQHGIRTFNLQPGEVQTERKVAIAASGGSSRIGVCPPSAIGAVAAWLVSTPEGQALSGQNVEAQDVCRERQLHPAWD